MMLAPVLTPHGSLTLRHTEDAVPLDPERGARLEHAFARGAGHGLLWLGANEVGAALPPVLSYWRELGTRYVTAVCALPGIADGVAKPRSPAAGRRHARRHGGSRSADGRRRIRHRRRAGRSVAGHRRGFRRRTSRGRGLGSGILETTASGLEPGRARAFQPGGKPQGRGSAVCVPGHLHHQALGVGQGPASAARQGTAGICRRAQSRGAAGAADAGTARGRIVRVAEGHGRFERRFFIRCAGPRCRRISSSKMFRRWSAPAWWCGCRRPGA